MIDDNGTKVRVICGSVWGATSPVDGIATDPHYIDVSIPLNTKKRIPIETQRHAFAYVFAGDGQFLDASDPRAAPTEWADVDNSEAMLEGEATGTPAVHAGNRSLVLFDRGNEIVVQSGEEGLRFLLLSGKPLQEPVAWHGPIVMNTRAELAQAYRDLQDGVFLKET